MAGRNHGRGHRDDSILRVIEVDQQASPGKPFKPYRFSTPFKWLTTLFLVFLLVSLSAIAAVMIDYINTSPPFDPARLAVVETSYIYDSRGSEVAVLHAEQHRIAIKLDQVPLHVAQAFIAVEDERFFRHRGFDLIASLRAAYANHLAGDIVQGGSTITQQLAQNAFLGSETTYRRKVQEIILSLELENNYSKGEILEMYLNRIYFGNGAYGVEAASQVYFNKSVNELTIGEAAMLAGITRSPNYYNPFSNKEEAEKRMQTVLASMQRLHFISSAEYDAAINNKMVYAELPDPEYPHPYFIDYVIHHELIRILCAMPGIDSREQAYQAIYTGGLRVYTTLEPELQAYVEKTMNREELYPVTYHIDMEKARGALASIPAGRNLTRDQLLQVSDSEKGIAQPQAAVVLADPSSGRIRALGGSREYRKNEDELLRFTTLRSPGSAIKPVITYGPALDVGTLSGAGSTLNDSPFTGPQNWKPQNFDHRFRGMIPLREALYYSFNVPAVRAFQDLGTRVGVSYAQKMGITSIDPSEIDNLSLTLGGFTHGVSAIDMTQAYSVFANDGLRIDLHTVEKIVDSSGEVIYEYRKNPKRVLSPQAAFIINDILQDFVSKYLGRALQIDRPVAAKTGTSENWNDVYLVAYTPNLVGAFWMGYDEPKLGSIRQGWRYSTVFMREIFIEVFRDLEKVDFRRPDGIIRAEACTITGRRPTLESRLAGTVRADYFIVDRYAED